MSLNVKVPSFGPQPAKVLIVGEAPGKDEEAYHTSEGVHSLVSLCGSSGQLLYQAPNEAGLIRADIRFTNVCPLPSSWQQHGVVVAKERIVRQTGKEEYH